MDKIKEKLIKDFKKASIERKIKLANKFGFETPSDYLAYLEGKEIREDIVGVPIPTIHNVIILDGSRSMCGSKFNNSVKGIKKELKYMMTDKTINWTSTIQKFSSWKENNSNPHFLTTTFNSEIDLGNASGGTPLHRTIISVINQILPKVGRDKVLIKIYTDGEDTDENRYLAECKSVIKSLDKSQFTVTFVGTETDVQQIIKDLDLDKSNTLVIENSGEGFEEAFIKSAKATATYATKVTKGEDVSRGFYLEIL